MGEIVPRSSVDSEFIAFPEKDPGDFDTPVAADQSGRERHFIHLLYARPCGFRHHRPGVRGLDCDPQEMHKRQQSPPRSGAGSPYYSMEERGQLSCRKSCGRRKPVVGPSTETPCSRYGCDIEQFMWEQHIMSAFKLLINGKLSEGAATLDVVNPATGRILASAPRASRAQLDEAVAAAKAAFPGWSKTPLRARAALLVKLADALEASHADFSRLLTEEQGKPLSEANVRSEERRVGKECQ